jgi:hypothetical protein
VISFSGEQCFVSCLVTASHHTILLLVAGMIDGLLSAEKGWVRGRRCAVMQGGIPTPNGGHQSIACGFTTSSSLSRFQEVKEMMLACGVVVS